MESDECEFDSTWEDEDENKTPRKKVLHRRSQRKINAAKDMQNFRHSCRNLDGDEDHDKPGQGRFYNLEFYRGQIKCSPDDVHISDFHQKWLGRYDSLQDVHTFTQWLFPLQTQGVNPSARVLTKKEIKLFRIDKQVKSKLVKSYELMLDFYGIRLVDESTGEVERASNWEDRFRNLNRYSNNNLRITRILKCLGTLGLEHYQAPLVKFYLHETLVKGQLQNVKQSVLDYFLFAVLDKSERRELVKYAFEHFKPQEHFAWGPKKILLGQVACCKNENVDQPTGNKQSSIAKGQPKRVNKDKLVIPNKLTETNSDQGVTKNSHCSSENVIVEMQDLKINDGFGDDDKITPANMSNGVQNTKPSEKGHQKKGKSVSPNKLTAKSIKIDQGANENSQCSSEKKGVEKQNQEMSIGDCDDDDDDDDVSGPHQTKEESSCEMSDMSHGDDNGSLQI